MIEEKKQGYRVKEYQGPVKRYCQVLNLKDDSKLIEEYRRRHSEGTVWPETLAAIREVGILEMEIYILGTTIFMIVETPLDFKWDEAMAKMATLPRQPEWEAYMAELQDADPNASSAEKWQLMERMFHLYEYMKNKRRMQPSSHPPFLLTVYCFSAFTLFLNVDARPLACDVYHHPDHSDFDAFGVNLPLDDRLYAQHYHNVVTLDFDRYGGR